MPKPITTLSAQRSLSQSWNDHTTPPDPAVPNWIGRSQDLLVLDDEGTSQAILLGAAGKDPNDDWQPLEHDYRQREHALSWDFSSRFSTLHLEESPAYRCPFAAVGHCSTLRGGCYHEAFASVANVERHLRKEHSRPKHYCKTCYELFNSEKLLKAHIAKKGCSVEEFPFSFPVPADTLLAIAACVGNNTQTEREMWNKIYLLLYPGRRELPSPFSPLVKPGLSIFRDVNNRQFRAPSSSSTPSLISSSTHSSTPSSVSSLSLSEAAHAPITFASLESIPVGGDYTSQSRKPPRVSKIVIAASGYASLLFSGIGSQFVSTNVDPYPPAPEHQQQCSQVGSFFDYIQTFLSAHEASKGIRYYTGRAAGSHDSVDFQGNDPTGSSRRSRDGKGANGSLHGDSGSNEPGSGNNPPPPGPRMPAAMADIDENDMALNCPLCYPNPIKGGRKEKAINDCEALERHLWRVHKEMSVDVQKNLLTAIRGQYYNKKNGESARIRRWRAICTALTGLSEGEQFSPLHPTLLRTHRMRTSQRGIRPLKKVKISTQVAVGSTLSANTVSIAQNVEEADSNHNKVEQIRLLEQEKASVEASAEREIAPLQDSLTEFEIKIKRQIADINAKKAERISRLWDSYFPTTEQNSIQAGGQPSQDQQLHPGNWHNQADPRTPFAGYQTPNLGGTRDINDQEASAPFFHGQPSPDILENPRLGWVSPQRSFQSSPVPESQQPSPQRIAAEVDEQESTTLVASGEGGGAREKRLCADCEFDARTGQLKFLCGSCLFAWCPPSPAS